MSRNNDDVLDRIAAIFDRIDAERIKAEVLEESRLKRERSEKNELRANSEKNEQRANKEEKPDPYQAIVNKYKRK